MVQLIVGNKGKGKTKHLLDKVNAQVLEATGNIVYLDKNTKHMYELNNKVRLINVSDYMIATSDEFVGFLSGIISQDHDLQMMFLDNFLSIAYLEDKDMGGRREAYDVYRNIVLDKSKESNVIDFDKFQFWAEMILNDFNDADKYLVDAKQLFANVKNLKEISSNFLTEEQIDVINKFWGETYHIEDISSFWKHIQHADEGDALSHQFIKLWEILFELYSSFKERLNSMGLCYQGMLYRQVAENIKTNYVDKLDSKRYIFVGFNVMSFSEIKIFEQLKTIGRADFYWDFNSPAYVYKENRATRFVGKYVTQFKSLYKIEEELITKFPSINVIGVPSNVGQVKEASSIISQLEVNGEISGVNTAIVFPDENLFIPMLHSLPEKINNVNITMGFPLRHTSIASLVVNVTSMQLRARIVQGEYQFFYEDILNILSHPIINSIAYEESRDLMRHIKNNRIFNISSDYIKENYSKLSVIFTAVKNLNKTKDVLDYLKSLVLWIRPQLQDEKVLDKLQKGNTQTDNLSPELIAWLNKNLPDLIEKTVKERFS